MKAMKAGWRPIAAMAILAILGPVASRSYAQTPSEALTSPQEIQQVVASLDVTSSSHHLQHPERFGLLGQLAGHGLWAHDGPRGIQHVQFYVSDSKTIEIAHLGNMDDWDSIRSQSNRVIGVHGDGILTKFYEVSSINPIVTPNSFTLRGETFFLTANGNLVSSKTGHVAMWAKLDQQTISEMRAQLEHFRPEIEPEIRKTDAEIAAKCTPGSTEGNCEYLYRYRNGLLNTIGADVPDNAVAQYDDQKQAALLARMAERNEQARQENAALLGQAFGVLSSNFVAAQARRAEAHNAGLPSGNYQSTTSTIAMPSAASAQITSSFGQLPNGVGTPAQRQFWTQRCQNIPNDDSPAAAGCRQTRQSLKVSPSQPTTAVAAGGLMPSGSSTSRGPGTVMSQASAMPVNCVSIAPGKRASLHNGCGFTVMVEYCTTTPQAGSLWQCRQDGGAGLDTISAGADMNTAISIGNDDYNGGYLLHWAACRGGLSTAEFRPHISNFGKTAICRKP